LSTFDRMGRGEPSTGRSARFVAALLAVAFAPMLLCAQAPAADSTSLDALERRVTADPENLKLAADYRQLTIAAGAFDRSIDLFEKLAKRKDSGPNVQISLAFAYFDKVPPSGDLRRLSLGRGAIGALTRSIEQRPSLLAYTVRGRTSLYFNRRLFRRVAQGIADLEKALTMVTADVPPIVEANIYTSLGDGYWEEDKREKAREIWRAGAAKFPANAGLHGRIAAGDAEADRMVRRALDPSARVDTSLKELYPE
jgi:tetratricopeptide (TPR) repeat protein